jgi:hypothetical protein
MSFPPAHALIGAGLAEIVIAAKPLPRWKAWAVAGFLAVSPDFDIVIGLMTGRGASLHGTFSHSVTAVVVLTLTVYAMGGGRWALVAGSGYGSHLLVDMLDDTGPTNLMLGWPFTPAEPYASGSSSPGSSSRRGTDSGRRSTASSIRPSSPSCSRRRWRRRRSSWRSPGSRSW